MSDIQELSTWTLATDTPTAVTLEHLLAVARPSGPVELIGLLALLLRGEINRTEKKPGYRCDTASVARL